MDGPKWSKTNLFHRYFFLNQIISRKFFKDGHFNVKAFHDDYFLFIGAKYGEKICQCGALVPNQCFKLSNMENENHCNCDQKDAVYRQDSGFITNMVNKWGFGVTSTKT